MSGVSYGSGTADDPWLLRTPPGTSEYAAWRDGDRLEIAVGKTRLAYLWRALEDCAAMLEAQEGWVPLGNADEGKPAAPGSVEAWARDPGNPVGGYYGLRRGYRGRFANYVLPVMELHGLAELDHAPRSGKARRAQEGPS